jgi:trehalose-6-phosphate synthase
MNIREFEQTWETEYISNRVKSVTSAVKSGSVLSAIDYLKMIQDKAKAAQRLLEEHLYENGKMQY